jgi:TctA family transporter
MVYTQCASHLKKGAIPTAYINQIIPRAKFYDARDFFVHGPGHRVLITTTKGEIVRIAKFAGGLAAVLDVIVGLADHCWF